MYSIYDYEEQCRVVPAVSKSFEYSTLLWMENATATIGNMESYNRRRAFRILFAAHSPLSVLHTTRDQRFLHVKTTLSDRFAYLVRSGLANIPATADCLASTISAIEAAATQAPATVI